MTSEWFSLPQSQNVSKIRCFVADMQEPYMILRHDKSTPLYNDKFYNYGYNKVQLFEHLRAAGFQFYLLNHAFAIDVPHPNSDFRNNYITNTASLLSKMKRAFIHFLFKLDRQYSTDSRFPICNPREENYYSVIWCVC